MEINGLPYGIDCRDILQSGILVTESFCINGPHGSGIDIDKKDIVAAVTIPHKLIIDCGWITDPVFGDIIPKDVPSDRLTFVICYQRNLTSVLVQEILAEIL